MAREVEAANSATRTADPPQVREPLGLSWARRALTIPAYVLAFLLVWALSPALLSAAFLVDVVRRRGLVILRCVLMLMAFLLAEMIGIVASLVIWLRSAGWRRRPTMAYLDRNFRLQCWWATFLFRAGERLFRLRVHVEGDELLAHGPLILFVRHASPVDNLIPAVYGSSAHGLRLRWLVNRWLLRDPCIDIVGNRLPNAFVRSGTHETDKFLRMARELASGMTERDGVLTYPEGGLFGGAKRDRVIGRMAEVDPDAARKAAALRHLLPPRIGGSLALLDAAAADVVFCAHTGLEVAGSYRALLSGDLIGRNVRITFWRVPRGSLPEADSARADWLWKQWQRVDDWIAANSQSQLRGNR